MEIRNNPSNIKFKGAIKIKIPQGSKNYAITKDLLLELKKWHKPYQIGHIRKGDELNINFHNSEIEKFSVDYLKWRGIKNLSYHVKSSLSKSEFHQFVKSGNFDALTSEVPLHGAIKMPFGYDFKAFINKLQRVNPKSAKEHLQQAIRSKDGTEISIPFYSPESKKFALQYFQQNKISGYTILNGHILKEDSFEKIAS